MADIITLQVTDKQMQSYTDLIYQTTGIAISLQKKQLLSNRIRRRLKATGMECFDQYFNHLKKLKITDAEWDGFLQEVTTHETYLFRDENHWKWLRETYLPELMQVGRSGKCTKAQKIWSAASSTGDEAHSIGCCLLEAAGIQKDWKFQVIGTDIGVGAVEKAKEGIFNKRAMKLVPVDFKRRYFDQMGSAEIWQAKPVLKKLLKFKQHNLLNPPADSGFDLVFLKNVLIYFDRPSKEKVIKHVTKVMKPGSYLIAGGAEGISDLLKGYERIQPWLFKKQN